MKREIGLSELLGKRLSSYSVEMTKDCPWKTLRLDFEDDTFIQILTPVGASTFEIAEYGKSIIFNPLGHEQTK